MYRSRLLLLIVAFAITATIVQSADATIIADVVADYVPGTNAGDIVTPAATGTGSWRYLTSETQNPTDADENLGELADLQWDTTGLFFERPVHDHINSGYDGDRLDVAGGEMRFGTPARQLGVPDVFAARWTAGPGEAGLIDITGTVRQIVNNGTGVRFLIFVDGVVPPHFEQVIVFGNGLVPINLSGLSVNVGSTVDFVADPNGSNEHDLAGLTAVIRLVPEPSGLILAVVGLLGFGIFRRGNGHPVTGDHRWQPGRVLFRPQRSDKQCGVNCYREPHSQLPPSKSELYPRIVTTPIRRHRHDLGVDNLTITVHTVPEPGTLAAYVIGFVGVGLVYRRRRTTTTFDSKK